MALPVLSQRAHKQGRRRSAMTMLLLMLFLVPGLANAQDTNHDVVIVGAGAAGLYAAYTLDNLGFGVLVFEAMDRRGGRVHPSYQHDLNFRLEATSEFGAEEVESSSGSFLQDDIHTITGSNRLSNCFVGDYFSASLGA